MTMMVVNLLARDYDNNSDDDDNDKDAVDDNDGGEPVGEGL